jgi:signal transduction histidine kinase
VTETSQGSGDHYIMGYAPIDRSPFILMALRQGSMASQNWFDLRKRLLGFLAVSVLIIILLIMGTSTYLVRRMHVLDSQRARILHNIEYTSKLASIGRLAAGVAHEINNPMAIINEKAGLMKDLLSLSDDFPRKEKFLSFVDSIQGSVERCRTVTHRLLGFAKHMDVEVETIDLEHLIKEVLGFVDKDASFRKLAIHLRADENLPMIESDKSQLQQVFVNIINNAFEAVEDGGRIDISLRAVDSTSAMVVIRDNGQGIPQETLTHIFEPFFSTKGKYGTGLGLSITHGIVQKLGGNITVKSKVGQGTEFRVTIPIKKFPER